MIQCFCMFILNSYVVVETADKLIKTRTERRKVREVEGRCSVWAKIITIKFSIRDAACSCFVLSCLFPVSCLSFWIDNFSYRHAFYHSRLFTFSLLHLFLIKIFFFRLLRSDPSNLSLSLLIYYTILPCNFSLIGLLWKALSETFSFDSKCVIHIWEENEWEGATFLRERQWARQKWGNRGIIKRENKRRLKTNREKGNVSNEQ